MIGFRLQGSGFRDHGLGFRVKGLGIRVGGLGVITWKSFFRIESSTEFRMSETCLFVHFNLDITQFNVEH